MPSTQVPNPVILTASSPDPVVVSDPTLNPDPPTARDLGVNPVLGTAYDNSAADPRRYAESPDGEPTVTMFFETRTTLQLDDGKGTLVFEPGIQEVPASIADHWWLRSQAVPYKRTSADEKELSDLRAEKERQLKEESDAAQKKADADVKAAEVQAEAEIATAKAKADAKVADVKAKADLAASKKAVRGTSAIATSPRGPITMKHVTFIQRRGYSSVTTVDQAKAFISNLTPAEQTSFYADFDKTGA
jgi:hypothetical protein